MFNFNKGDKVWVIDNIMGGNVVTSGIFKDEILVTDNKWCYLVDCKYIEYKYIFKTEDEAKRYLECEL